jgi:hypothetical protein
MDWDMASPPSESTNGPACNLQSHSGHPHGHGTPSVGATCSENGGRSWVDPIGSVWKGYENSGWNSIGPATMIQGERKVRRDGGERHPPTVPSPYLISNDSTPATSAPDPLHYTERRAKRG